MQDTTASQASWVDWRTPISYNGSPDANWTGLPCRAINRHSSRCVMGFVDFHTEKIKASGIGFYAAIGSSADRWSGQLQIAAPTIPF